MKNLTLKNIYKLQIKMQELNKAILESSKVLLSC